MNSDNIMDGATAVIPSRDSINNGPQHSLETRKRKLEDELVFSEEIVSQHVKLEPVPDVQIKEIPTLTKQETEELRQVLEIDGGTNDWCEDWAGNLGYADSLKVGNPKVRGAAKKTFKQTLFEWAHSDRENAKYIWFLICVVCNNSNVPPSAKRILAGVDLRSLGDMEKAIRRVGYDPQVLADDGWTTSKSRDPQGATGGPYLIGDLLFWDGSDAVIIAYIHDPDIGDLWKAIWLGDDDETQSFDLEAEEIREGKIKWERRNKQQKVGPSVRRANRLTVSEDFSVNGVELGIVLGTSYSKGARPGVFWPARMMHASEASGSGGQSKRSSAKQKVDLVFLVPYWGEEVNMYGGRRKVEGLSESQSSSGFDAKPLLHIETVEATDEMIKEYPYNAKDGLDIDSLRISFRFTGLPKAAFSRFVDSHRLALCLQRYASRHLQKTVTAADRATAGLFDSHPLSVRAPLFPSYSLNLPFQYILSQLPRLLLSCPNDDGDEEKEDVIQLDSILNKMRPPMCWNRESANLTPSTPPTQRAIARESSENTPWKLTASSRNGSDSTVGVTVEMLVEKLDVLKQAIDSRSSSSALVGVLSELEALLSLVVDKKKAFENSPAVREQLLAVLVQSWALVKQHGEEALLTMPGHPGVEASVEWRRASERLYRYITSSFESEGVGNGVSAVLTDIRCNGHVTSRECFERAVRLPAALKGAKLAGAGTKQSCRLVPAIEDAYISYAERSLLPKVHDGSYLKRMQVRCASASSTATVVLTDNSDGEGGCDTHGSRGTWTAAVTAVAAAVKATDMVVRGDCVNAFCATRPPGHHAGKQLHPMKAVSNGFCVLNAAASAAIHATSPVSEGGLGLRKVCIIDFDVHHGNGTQDILCSTFDSRYLYVSMHAGGSGVNGVSMEDDPNHELHDLASSKKGGIYPGRCGDTSPHKGVLNIPLGARVLAQSVATALLNTVTPAVNEFAPDLIILSAGFDAHRYDPMCLGALDANAFGTITEVCCQLAKKWCNGRVVSILEGGYGVPCCRPQQDLFLPPLPGKEVTPPPQPRQQPSKLLNLGGELPDDMDDQVPMALQRRLEKCHAEGFIECVKEHVQSLLKCNKRFN